MGFFEVYYEIISFFSVVSFVVLCLKFRKLSKFAPWLFFICGSISTIRNLMLFENPINYLEEFETAIIKIIVNILVIVTIVLVIKKVYNRIYLIIYIVPLILSLPQDMYYISFFKKIDYDYGYLLFVIFKSVLAFSLILLAILIKTIKNANAIKTLNSSDNSSMVVDKKCSGCGSPIVAGAAFCGKCGMKQN